jgi:hypothetical protein
MSKPQKQRHVSWQEAVEQGRRNRRRAAILESRDGLKPSAEPEARPISRRASTVRK